VSALLSLQIMRGPAAALVAYSHAIDLVQQSGAGRAVQEKLFHLETSGPSASTSFS
jgi:hypothetical protein